MRPGGLLGLAQSLPGRRQVADALRALGSDLPLLVEVVLLGLGQVRAQRAEERGHQPDPDFQTAPLPVLLDEQFANLGGHLIVRGAGREATAGNLVGLITGFLVPRAGAPFLLFRVEGQQEPLRSLRRVSPGCLPAGEVQGEPLVDELCLAGLRFGQLFVEALSGAAQVVDSLLARLDGAERAGVGGVGGV